MFLYKIVKTKVIFVLLNETNLEALFCLLFQNQIYVPPKDQSTCCGVCKNISCLYEHENGTTVLYKVEAWACPQSCVCSVTNSPNADVAAAAVFSAGEVLGV